MLHLSALLQESQDPPPLDEKTWPHVIRKLILLAPDPPPGFLWRFVILTSTVGQILEVFDRCILYIGAPRTMRKTCRILYETRPKCASTEFTRTMYVRSIYVRGRT